MTNKRYVQFGLLDLSTVHLACGECHVRVEYPIDAFGTTTRVLPHLPDKCPQCGTEWGLDQDGSVIRSVLFALAKHRDAVDNGKNRVTLQFGMPDNGTKAAS